MSEPNFDTRNNQIVYYDARISDQICLAGIRMTVRDTDSDTLEVLIADERGKTITLEVSYAKLYEAGAYFVE